MRQMKALAYIRVSTWEQVDEGVSLALQRERIAAYCAMRGLELVEMLQDSGVSATVPMAERPAGTELLRLIQMGAVGAVVAFKLDRLFRNCADCLGVTGEWDRGQVALHLVDMGGQAVDTSTAMGRFFLTVMAGAAEMERNVTCERTRAALAHKRQKGEIVNFQPPYGHKREDRRVVLHSEEQDIIETIHRMHAEGISMRGIAQELNLHGLPARGSRWHLTSVARILSRPLNRETPDE